MRFIIIILLVSCIALFSCSGDKIPDLAFEEDDEGFTVIGERATIIFTAEAPWEVDGVISHVHHESTEPFNMFSGS
ncbi:MAG: hypothetical protein GY859_29910, partial [Desulfobacterales bacterium]|nr:hypothetical protein [Desulfobacterales bacterium]